MRYRNRRTTIVLTALLVLAGCGRFSGSHDARPLAARPGTTSGPPRMAWVSVPVATVWNSPDLVRPVDAADLAVPPKVGQWLSGLSFDQRLDLDNRLATQALLNDRVVVLDEAGAWAHVLISDQRGSVYPSGIAGWVPMNQLTFQSPPVTGTTATVAAPLVNTGKSTLSYGTRLPILSSGPSTVVALTPDGPQPLLRSDVRLNAPTASGAAVVREAERFLGLPYLWAGTSGFGFDCSGLSYMVYRQFGITLARDAADQAQAGAPVARTDLRPGDLVFFQFGGTIDHVGIYAGGGRMIDAPQTGSRVEVVPMWGTPLAAHFVAARRYVP